jgi:outer membrane immunogenic protein
MRLSPPMPVKAPIVAATSYNWTGIYGGVHLGYGRGMKDWTNSSFDYDVAGFLGGGQIGVNQQIGNWVIGIEADASWASIKGAQTITVGGTPVVNFLAIGSATTNIDRVVTVAGRIGFAQDRWLVYAKLGAAWAHENHSFSIVQSQTVVGAGTITQTAAATGSENRFGPMIGFGAEFVLWGNWSVKSEYNYLHVLQGGRCWSARRRSSA